jgi:hypothetical protein
LTLTGTTVKDVKVGTFQYPRRGQCGCWERNLYADFTPTYRLPYTHVQATTVYRNEIRPDPEWELSAFLLSLVVSEQGDLTWLGMFNDATLHTMAGQLSSGQRLFFETTVRQDFNDLDFAKQRVDWSMSKTYKKNGESWKISNVTCKSKLKLLDIKEITGALSASFPGLHDKLSQLLEYSPPQLVSERVVGE